MRVLVGCEFSGIVRDAFSSLGHDAWSCDILPSERDGNHFQCDVRDVIDMDWDIGIFHPPCRYLSNSGVHLLKKEPGRWEKMIDAARFFKLLLDCNIPKICVENPVMHSYGINHIGTNYTQTIQPYNFGDDASKRTCLWLKDLPKLIDTEFIKPDYICSCGYRFEYDLGKYGCPNCNGCCGAARQIWGNQTKGGQNKLPPSKTRSQDRSRTFAGIAQALAIQFTAFVESGLSLNDWNGLDDSEKNRIFAEWI